MLDTSMYVKPGNKKSMTPKEVAQHAVKWAAESLWSIGSIIGQAIPREYVQVLRDPETGDEWLHYGTRWMDAEVTDTKVKLAPRLERLKQERRDLAAAEEQLETMKMICEDQRRRVKDYEDRLNAEMSNRLNNHTSDRDADAPVGR